ncbi:MAG TPA: hypothetical protein VFQ27_10995 [Xanthobacteraceae bacterium]|nr:hypothetical protein [Xanthobacteraceae bacterium]
MLNLGPRFLLSPRFLALPLIALGVIIALAQTGKSPKPTATQVAEPRIYRAVNCTNPANAGHPACGIARGDVPVRIR